MNITIGNKTEESNSQGRLRTVGIASCLIGPINHLKAKRRGMAKTSLALVMPHLKRFDDYDSSVRLYRIMGVPEVYFRSDSIDDNYKMIGYNVHQGDVVLYEFDNTTNISDSNFIRLIRNSTDTIYDLIYKAKAQGKIL